MKEIRKIKANYTRQNKTEDKKIEESNNRKEGAKKANITKSTINVETGLSILDIASEKIKKTQLYRVSQKQHVWQSEKYSRNKSKKMKEKAEQGLHPFQTPKNIEKNRKIVSECQKAKAKIGIHIWQSEKFKQLQSIRTSERNRKNRNRENVKYLTKIVKFLNIKYFVKNFSLKSDDYVNNILSEVQSAYENELIQSSEISSFSVILEANLISPLDNNISVLPGIVTTFSPK